MEMVLSPKSLEHGTEPGEDMRHKVPWVAWIAITLGVVMFIIGLLLLLWGFAWQTDVGEPQKIEGSDLKGGVCLIPMGAGMVTVGLMWLITGWRGFRKDELSRGMKRCPNCGKAIESDLNFCYYCNTTFDDDVPDDQSAGSVDEGAGKAGGKAGKARPFYPREPR